MSTLAGKKVVVVGGSSGIGQGVAAAALESGAQVAIVGALTLAKHAVKGLKPGGSMTFTSGINKDRPPVPGGAVVAAIAGSFGYLAHALALELAPTRVNIVSPGWVDTPMWDELVGAA